MATSGTTAYQLDRDTLVTAAIRKLGVLADGAVPTSTQLADGVQALNFRVSQFRPLGLKVFQRKEYTFALTTNVNTYLIGVGQTLNTPFPLNLLQAYNTENNVKIDMDIIPDYDFNQLPLNSTGRPVQMRYQPFINYGQIKVWPTPDSNAALTNSITIVYSRPLEYFTGSTNTMDFPEEWYLALVYSVAVDLAPEWGVPIMDRQKLEKEQEKHLLMAMDTGGEDGSLFFMPDQRHN